MLECLFYSSDEFQTGREQLKGKVNVYIDPDDLNFATAAIPLDPRPYALALQTTVFADLTASDFLELMTHYRRENPEVTELYEGRIAKVRLARHAELKKIGVERRLHKSYVNAEEARKKANVLFASSRLTQTNVWITRSPRAPWPPRPRARGSWRLALQVSSTTSLQTRCLSQRCQRGSRSPTQENHFSSPRRGSANPPKRANFRNCPLL